MYDRVHARASTPDPSDVLRRLPSPTEVRLPDGEPVYRGTLGPFRYSLRGSTLRLRGSLASYVGQVPPEEIALLAIARLSDALGFDVGTAAVTRLEVFADLVLPCPVCLYLPLLYSLPRHKRLTVHDASGRWQTLKFMTLRRAYQLYNKGEEDGTDIGGRLLRLELSYKNGGVADHFGGGLTFADLGTLAVRSHLASEWSGWYGRIEKGRALRPDLGAADFFRALAVERIVERGVGDVLAEIAAHKQAGVICKTTAQARRRAVLRDVRSPLFTAPSPRIAELDAAVAEAAARMGG